MARTWTLGVVALGAVSGTMFGACRDGPDGPASDGDGEIVIELSLDTTTDYADYSDGYEVRVEVRGPEDITLTETLGTTVFRAVDRTMPAGSYTVRAALLPCGTDDELCGPGQERCAAGLDLRPGRRVVVTVDFQPGRDCTIRTS